MDIRAVPYPADFKILSTPGSFTGWSLSIEKGGRVSNMVVFLDDTPEQIANKLRALADQVAGNQSRTTQ